MNTLCDADKEFKCCKGTAAKKAFINGVSFFFFYDNFIMTASSVNATAYNAFTHQPQVFTADLIA